MALFEDTAVREIVGVAVGRASIVHDVGESVEVSWAVELNDGTLDTAAA